MAQETFNNGDQLQVVRGILNGNATDAEARLTANTSSTVQNSTDISDLQDEVADLGAGAKTVLVLSTTYEAEADEDVMSVEYTNTAPVTITLPALSDFYDSTTKRGRQFIVCDTGVNASVNNITIQRKNFDLIIDSQTSQTEHILAGDGLTAIFQPVPISGVTGAAAWKVLL